MTPMTHSRLPGLEVLLDPGALRTRLDPIRDERGTVVAVTPFYMRWKPGTNALLGVRLTWQTGEGVAETLASLYLGDRLGEAMDKAETLRLLEPALGPAIGRLDDTLYLAFPNDRLLKGLSAAADPRRLINRFVAVGAPASWRGRRAKKSTSLVRAVRWKPGRRAVLELNMKLVDRRSGEIEPWRAFARVMPAAELEAKVARWRAAGEVPAAAAPRVEIVDPERGWFATAAAPGRPLSGTPSTPVRAALGRALAALHASPAAGLPLRDDREDLAAAERALRSLVLVAADLESRALALVARLRGALAPLAPVTPVFTHGDMGADQILVHGEQLALIDWDEAANGDPHADWASLLADLRARGLSGEWVVPLAGQVLAERFDPARFAWSYAAAEARRVVESLQRGRADWRARALDGLSAAERALDEVAGEAEAARPVPRSARVGGWLASLLDPSLRLGVPGVDARVSRVGAVWPDGDEGAIVRLERSDAPGPAARWLKLDDAVCAFDFPSDPGLPALAGLLTGGSFAAAGHRLGKRAALRELHGDRFLFLRAPRAARKAFERVRESHRRLEAVGVAASRPLEFVESLSGWWAEGIPGRALEPAREEPGVWAALGELLSRAHAAHGGDLPTTDGRAASLDAARKQVSLVRLADPAFADELDRDLSELPVGGTTGRLAWTHGDLHPLQILVGPRLVVLDWERARVGEAEEDLGNLLAHLAWAAEDTAAEAWRAFLAGYARAGGEWDSRLLLWNARVSMVRVRAVHGWRDGSHARARDTARWRQWRQAVVTW